METILIATDAWEPQINGVVTTLTQLRTNIKTHNVVFITPNDFKTFTIPFYSQINLALPKKTTIDNLIRSTNPNYIHIATEGPVGYYVRQWCIKNNKKFTTSYHTKFPEIIEKHFYVPQFISRQYLKKFHSVSSGVFCASPSLKKQLIEQDYKNIISWSRGVDTQLFKPDYTKNPKNKMPTFLYVGRVSKEKNLEDFLSLNLPGNIVIVGDGPQLDYYRNKYSSVNFVGSKTGKQLVEYYQSADVFCFPSRSDTFGIVILEALACGLPVAGYNVTGPKDIITSKTGVLSDDLYQNCIDCLKLQSYHCVQLAKNYQWSTVAEDFVNSLVNI